MAQKTMSQEQKYLEAWHSSIASNASALPGNIHVLRESAIAKFSELGFPTRRRGNEEWKYTDVRSIANASFESLVSSPTNQADDKTLFPHIIGGTVWNRMVFFDGHWLQDLSSLPKTHPGNSGSMDSVRFQYLAWWHQLPQQLAPTSPHGPCALHQEQQQK